MNGFIAFFRKEWLEALRTKRLLILLITFTILGILSPFTTLLTPMIMEMSFPEGVVLQIPDPNAIDAWASFFKNISQMGTIIVLLLFGGMLANDVQKQALIPLLTKGLSRSSVILAKLAINYLLWTAAYVLSLIIAFSYTVYYWDMSIVSNLALALIGAWLCGLFLITVLMLFSALSLSFSGALFGTAGVIGLLLILPLFEDTNRFNSLMLFNQAASLLSGTSITDTLWQISTTTVLIVVLNVISIRLFNKKQL